jgi:5S rRNA maturation endonuclease (ribonuclease M5)
MNYNTGNILNSKSKHIGKEDILSKTTEYSIFAKYIGNFKIGHIYNSPLREDKSPSFGVFVSHKTGSLLYKDMASGDCGDVFNFVKKYKNLSTYNETFKQIREDMSIDSIVGSDIKANRRYEVRESHISVVRKPFTQVDKDFWGQFKITQDTLKLYKVDPIQKYLINGLVKSKYENDNPMYCYKVFNRFKIYKPYETKLHKWRGNLSALDIFGFEQLPESGDLLIITKSLKDVMVLKELGYDAVAPSSESTIIPDVVIENLKAKFKKIVIFYDRDKTGMTFARQLSSKHKFNAIFINKKYKTKDISDLVKKAGYVKTLTIFEQMIN